MPREPRGRRLPKFRGGSDDWLDDEESKRKAKAKAAKVRRPQPVPIPAEETNAMVAEVFPNQCRVRMDEDHAEFLCPYRRAGVMGAMAGDYRERAPVAVGDRVRVARSGSDAGVVEGVAARTNSITRPAPGHEGEEFRHVIAANIDTIAIVASVHTPDFSPGLVDRYLVAASAAGIQPVLCVTKIDIHEADQPQPWEIYSELKYPVFRLTARNDNHPGNQINELRRALATRTVVFCGHSGVGKTSLLRVLIGTSVGKVGDVSGATGKGKHTTTSAVLLAGPSSAHWIDTPGVREFGLTDVSPESLPSHFPEFLNAGCDIAGCLHRDEPGCRATQLPRYASYRRILESLFAGER